MIKKKKKTRATSKAASQGTVCVDFVEWPFYISVAWQPQGVGGEWTEGKAISWPIDFWLCPNKSSSGSKNNNNNNNSWSRSVERGNNQSAVAGMLASKNCQRKRAEKYYCTFWLLPIKRLLRDALHLSAHVLSFDFHRLQLAPQIIFALGLIEFWLHFSAALTTATILKLAFQVRRLAVRQSAFLCCHRCGHSVTHANHVKT